MATITSRYTGEMNTSHKPFMMHHMKGGSMRRQKKSLIFAIRNSNQLAELGIVAIVGSCSLLLFFKTYLLITEIVTAYSAIGFN